MASNKQDKILFDNDEFVTTYVEKILKKHPEWNNESDRKYVFELFKAGSGENIRNNPKLFTIAYGLCSHIWSELRLKAGLEKKAGTSYREYFCNFILGIDYTIVQDEFIRLTEKAPEEPYPHETAEKPTKLEVMNLVRQQNKNTSILDEVIKLLPLCSDAELAVLESYTRARKA